jgi:hypothetical protein
MIHMGHRYIYVPPTAVVVRLVEVYGVAYAKGRGEPQYLVRQVLPDGKTLRNPSEVTGWFKSARDIHIVTPAEKLGLRAKKQLDMKITAVSA